MIEAGHFAAFLALALSLAQGVLGLRGERRLAGLVAVTAFFVMAMSFLTIINAFIISDFSVALVANNSHTLKPMIYKIAGAWGNHEGSMALWCLVTIGFGAAAGMKSVFATLCIWQERALMRHRMAALDDRMLDDMGLTRAAVDAEAAKPFWRA